MVQPRRVPERLSPLHCSTSRRRWLCSATKGLLMLVLFTVACLYLPVTLHADIGLLGNGNAVAQSTHDAPTVSSSLVHGSTNNNSLSSPLPAWACKYFDWHAKQRKTMSSNSNHQYLIYTCLQSDASCGGLSDRIKSLPYFLYLAARSKRIYLIYWSRPCRLEEFLLPPPNGLDWTTPDWLAAMLVQDRSIPLATTHTSILQYVESADHPIVTARLQDQHGGSDYYNQQQALQEDGPRAFRRSFRALFYKCFTPTPPLANAIHIAMTQLQLQPGHYTAAHFRAKYNERHPLPDTAVKGLARNAVNCASQWRRSPSEHIYFASDSQLAVQAVVEYRATTRRNIVTSPMHQDDPLHLDKATSTTPSDYYSAFVDLFVLSNANGIAHGQGGYGRLAVLLSQNASCFKSMVTGGRIVECKWKEILA